MHSKLSPEAWAEARRLRAAGDSYAAIGRRFAVHPDTVASRAHREGWAATAVAPASATPARPRARHISPATADIHARLGRRLFSLIAYRVRAMELQMHKHLEACERGEAVPIVTKDQLDAFAAVIEQIKQVTELTSEPTRATDGRRRHASPGLTRLSDDIDPDGLAVASEKDAYAREIAEHLEKLRPPS